MTMLMQSTFTDKEKRVWTYLVKNRHATAHEIADATDTSTDFVDNLLDRIGSDNWREEIPARAGGTLAVQHGGDHYSKLDIQPWEAMAAWHTPEEHRGYHKAVAIGYLARERDKGGSDDIRKAVHHLQRLLEVEADDAARDLFPIEDRTN